jgi:hypothetical protein
MCLDVHDVEICPRLYRNFKRMTKGHFTGGGKIDGWKITKFRSSCFSSREVRLTITPPSFFLSWYEVSSHLQQQDKQELHDQGRCVPFRENKTQPPETRVSKLV